MEIVLKPVTSMRSTTLALLALIAATTITLNAQTSLGQIVDNAGAGWMIGEWKGKVQEEQVELSLKWAQNRHVISSHSVSSSNGNKVETHGLIMLAHKSGEVRGYSVLADGIYCESVWELMDGKPVEKVQAYPAGGEGGKIAYTFEKVDDATMKIVFFAGPQAWELLEKGQGGIEIILNRKQ